MIFLQNEETQEDFGVGDEVLDVVPFDERGKVLEWGSNPKSTQSRIPRENRLCTCGGGIEDEGHVVFDCVKTQETREKYGISNRVYGSIGEMMEKHDCVDLVDFVDECMKKF